MPSPLLFLTKLLKNEPTCIGLDVGTHAVKCVKIRRGSNSSATLLQHSVELLGPQRDPLQRTKAVQQALLAVGAEKSPVIAAVGGPGTVLRSVIIPQMTPDELKTALTFEVEKYIPFKLEEVFIDSAILGNQPGGRMEITLGAARKEVVQGLVEMLASAGTVPSAVDLEPVALANAWETGRPTVGVEPVGLVHIGARGTILNFLKETQLQFTREIPLGGDSFTKAIAEGLKVDLSEAERIKCQPGEQRGQLQPFLQPLWEQWHSQCRASFDFYENQFGQRVGRLYLSGGSCALGGFREWVQETVGLPTEPWNPLSGLQAAGDAEQLQAVAPVLAVAVGLGVRGTGR